MEKPKRKMKPESALLRLESLCARSEQATWELRRKLYAWGIAVPDADKIMEHLVNGKFADDHRFASAYCRDKFRFSRWGKVKITRGLIEKRIPKEYINEALDEIEEEEYITTLTGLIRAKAHSIDEPASYEGKTKLFRFAVSRGFEPAIAIKTINSGAWAEDD